jgi:hypothetical protein
LQGNAGPTPGRAISFVPDVKPVKGEFESGYYRLRKGQYKAFFYQLLSVEPTARILDMYASDMIYMIFKNIKDEFDAARGDHGRADDLSGGTTGRISTDQEGGELGSDRPEDSKSGWSKSGYWIGAWVLAVGGAAAWHVLPEEKAPGRHTIE